MSTKLPAGVGDNEFWLLAKQCAALGYEPVVGSDGSKIVQASLLPAAATTLLDRAQNTPSYSLIADVQAAGGALKVITEWGILLP